MKKNYEMSVTLRCPVCGSAEDFDYNDDKTYIKCNKCGKEFPHGYEELVELNQSNIQNGIDEMKDELIGDAKKYLHDSLKKAFRGNKHVKLI